MILLDQNRLTEKLQEILLQNKIAGMSVAVTDCEKVIYNHGFGFESAFRPNVSTHPDAMYKIASISKLVTAVMIMRLVEEEVLNLDIPIKNYLPWLKLSRPEAVEQITLRHLLTHIAGMPGDDFLEEGSRDEDTIEERIKVLLPTLPISALPSEKKYCYSSWGYNVIGCVASTVTGKALSRLISEYVLAPLGMDRTTFDYYIASTYPLSLPHRHDKEGNLQVVPYQRVNTVYHAGAGLYSNTSDMCKLMRFFLNNGCTDSGEILLTRDSLEDMSYKHMEKANDPGNYYGLGVSIRRYADRFLHGHTGNYHPYNSSAYFDKKTGFGIVTMFNSPVTDLRYVITEMILNMLEA